MLCGETPGRLGMTVFGLLQAIMGSFDKRKTGGVNPAKSPNDVS
jgi:hypothetical protein